jgi:NAD(P)H-flavin reductase
MSKILEKEFFSEKVVRIVLDAPEIAKSRKPGHFVIIKIGD